MIRKSVEGCPTSRWTPIAACSLTMCGRRGRWPLSRAFGQYQILEYEFQMALTNRKLNPEAETVFLTTTAEHMYLSSSLVKQVAGFGGDITGFVPGCIIPDIMEKIRKGEDR